MYSKSKTLEQISFFSDSLKKIVSNKLLINPDGSFSFILNDSIELIDPEFEIFDLCTLNVSGDTLVLMFNRNNLKICHLKNIIQLVEKLAVFYGEDDDGCLSVDSEQIEEIINWVDIDCTSIIRIWENALDRDCQVALHFSLANNNIFLALSNNLIN